MRATAKVFLGLLIALGLVRAMLYVSCVIDTFSIPFDVRLLESAMVHFAWRAQHAVRLYPDWETYPYVANFYAPLYFVIVGALGRAAGSDIEGLYRIGREVSVGSVLIGTLAIGLVLHRKYGAGAAGFGALLSLGAGPLFGAGIMTRPDALADSLGLIGFFLATSRKGTLTVVGGIALYLAALTKQTALIYLLAAVSALMVEARARPAAYLCACVPTALVLTVLAVNRWVEPNCARSLLGELHTPASLATWWHTLRIVATSDPEFFVLTPIGIALWARAPRREPALIALAVLLLATGLITCAKLGSAENYFLDLRSVAALAAGALWHELTTPEHPPRTWPLLAAAAAVACLAFSALAAEDYAAPVRATAALAANPLPELQEMNRFHRQLFRTARDPKGRLLTDLGVIDIHQGDRTLFADPYRFKLMVELKQIDPKRVCQLIDDEYYDLIISEHNMFSPEYESYHFGFPGILVEHARIHYHWEGVTCGVCIYTRRGRPSHP